MAIYKNFKYEIDENNAVRVWDTNEERPNGNPPIMFQPDYPNAAPFEDAAAAEAWVIQYLTEVTEWAENHPEEDTE